ncbi:glycoside hydrolase family 97 protein [Puteibacter caeruleilacunae]|nr:glycoside hydrolase family 97 protein [Puteibacter caeruleilacunae]
MRKFYLLVCLVITASTIMAKDFSLKSPNEKLQINISVENQITYSVSLDGQQILSPSVIDLTINSKKLGENAKALKAKTSVIDETLTPHVRQKFASFKNHCNVLTIPFKGRYALTFRAYDDGVAYRWSTSMKEDEVIVNSENVNFTFPSNNDVWFPEETQLYTHQEREYLRVKLSDITPERFGSTGMLLGTSNGTKVYVSEADLVDYPGMFLRGGDAQYQLHGKFAQYPDQTKQSTDRDVEVITRKDFIAKTSGNRTYPWRLMIITENDADLITSEMVYKLAAPLKLDDVSWIKPGKVAWDWWNANNIYGVDFKSGVNTETYKYFIDFAAEYNLEYIILDEGWYHLEDVLKVKKECDVQEIINYGKKKNVGVILWVTWKALDDKLDEALATFEKWGAKGVKVDFMQRDDQWMVQYYHKVAQKCADHKLLVDFHGCYKPTGMRRAYPNVITREGIHGGEQNKWTDTNTPEHHATLPFIRMVAGPMDYTPGAMINATKKNFRPVFSEPMGQGTRCHELALYVVFESPLQMLSDNPSNYYKEPECMQFLEAVPSVWDDTQVLQAKVSDYIAVARKSGDKWFVGALTDWDKRELKLDFSFLPAGDYKIKIWKDGINANRHAGDYKIVDQTITNSSKLNIQLAPGGGWVGIIEKK